MGIEGKKLVLAHGCEYDMLTGDLVQKIDRVKIPRERWLEVTKDIKDGKLKLVPDRENDLLTFLLGNPEHGGRARGLGTSYNMLTAFPDDVETYRSRARAKKRQEEEQKKTMSEFQRRLDEQQRQIEILSRGRTLREGAAAVHVECRRRRAARDRPESAIGESDCGTGRRIAVIVVSQSDL